MSTTPTQDVLSGIPAQASTSGTALAPFAVATIKGTNDSTDYVSCYVLNDNAAAGTLDVSKLPAGSFNAPAGGTLVMIAGTLATVQTALRALLFNASALAAGTEQTAHLTVVMSNTADGVSMDRSIFGSALQNNGVNVAMQGLPTPTTVADTADGLLFPKAVLISASGDGVSVTVSMSDPSLGAFDLAGVTGVTAIVNSNGSVTLSGGAASVGAGLDALRFVPVAQITGSVSSEIFTLAATDTVNHTTASGTVTTSITGSHSAVSLSGAATSATMDGGGSLAPFSALSIRDQVAGSLTATITLGSTANGHLDLSQLPSAAANGVTSHLSSDGSTLVLTGAAASVQADLQALRFTAANPTSGSLSETIGLTVATAGSGSATTTESLLILSSGTAPVLSGAPTVLQSSNTAVQLYPGVLLSGPSTAVDATISLSDSTVARFDEAGFETREDGNKAVSFSFDATGSTLRIEGATADVEAALRAVGLVTAKPATAVRSQEVATISLSADAGIASYATTIMVDGPALQADSLSAVPSTMTATQGSTVQPFAQATINDPNTDDTLTVSVVSSVANVFDPASLGKNATLSANGSTVTLTGSAAAVAAALNDLGVRVPQGDAGQSIAFAVHLATQAGSSTLSSAPITETMSTVAPAYSSDTSSDATGRVFSVSSDSAATARIDLSANTSPGIVVFGGKAALDLRAANAVVVLNGANQTGAVTIDSLGNDMVWMGAAQVDVTAGGHDRFVLGNEANTSSTVTLHGGTGADTSEFDVWGDGSQHQTIATDGLSSSTVFGGADALDFTGGNATLVTNGSGQTGAVTIHSSGGNTVWTGAARVDLFEGSGNDTVILTGGSTTVVHGAAAAESGTTTVLSFGSTGQFTYDGGDKAANLSLMGGSNTVTGGSAAQTVTMSGGGSLLVSDNAQTTGAQHVTMAQGSTASLQFLGGANPAMLVLGAGAATIQAGTNTTITGGTGTATINLSAAVGASLSFDGSRSGAVDITGFNPSHATAALSHVATSSVQNGSLVVSFNDGAQATFQGYADPNHAGISFG